MSQLPSLEEREKQLRDAVARAGAAHDNRPYPVGWPDGTLPFNHDPKIAESIALGQTMSQVAEVMGQKGRAITESRAAFLDRISKAYKVAHSDFKAPEDYRKVIEVLPAGGRFVSWQYQGFPSTADWVVVFFASTNGELRVVSRGAFGLGDF